MSKGKGKERVTVGVSVGDPNGIGIEVILKAFQDPRVMSNCTPVLYGSSQVLNYHRKVLDLGMVNYNAVKKAEDIKKGKLNLVEASNEELQVTLGQSGFEAGKYAANSLRKATKDLAEGKVDVLVTAPIDKNTIQSDDFKYSGHTEFLAAEAGTDEYLMILVSEGLRVGTITGHIPLKEVSSTISKELILSKLDVMNKSLQMDFFINKPRIAVLGLNPHAGDTGLIGDEESKVISPAIREAKESGILAFGPFGADGFFGSSEYLKYDGVLAMYHDQGLAPFKALSFGNGVNFTAGLPIVRTSPDHGTAYDIAGKGVALEGSFRSAVYLAMDVFHSRKEYKELTADPLKISKQKRGE